MGRSASALPHHYVEWFTLEALKSTMIDNSAPLDDSSPLVDSTWSSIMSIEEKLIGRLSRATQAITIPPADAPFGGWLAEWAGQDIHLGGYGRFAHGCSLHAYHTGKCSVGSCGSYARVVGCDGLILEETISVGSFG
ncbi:uncharacterized protein BO96DRAFT_360718 [Aspergillus niger CBS 101883]|uniref:Uncharacterized protein n=2 Tax=Aspergillus niger TaxID=5061 RepID=A2QIP6_ASPNC|nr:uncharacterized protein BO96DRAFT_360718 [Aspergillus niger CBS 101883]XP_059600534.1 hypothetical protein An04g04260 [Aspergillus niger]PYH59446.1 hypothetical protein BO96DRAFT_360718 [Aspergillus niger CBS 101883]CAK38690.1 hypothetical protein An04g04260 [Aspergillus niger]